MFTVKEAPEGKYTPDTVAGKPRMELLSTTDTDATVKAVVNGEDAVEYNVPDTERSEDGKIVSDSVESPISSRKQLLKRLAEAEAQDKADLENLYGLTEEAEQARQDLLKEMDGAPEDAEQEQSGLTPEEMAQVRQAALNDAIARGRQLAQANDPQALAAQYSQTQQTVLADYNKKLEQVKRIHPDFDSTMAEVAQNDVPFSQAVTEALLTVGGPEVVYRLAKTPAKARELAALPDHVAVAKIGQMAAEANIKPQPTRQRSSLQPTRAVGGNVRAEQSPGEMSYREYCEWRDKNKSFRR